ncbi:OmpH family outer membrane protein [Burkholderiaceae bacterium DAT-1]|nr:OmpH family outer membrane protein [Burkholderiaceae bacterium DAT-1]
MAVLRYKLPVVSWLIGLSACVCADGYEPPARIAVIDTNRVMSESGFAASAEQRIRADFVQREQQIKGMEALLRQKVERLSQDAGALTVSERIEREKEISNLDFEFQRKSRQFREELAQRKSEELQVMNARILHAIRQVAESDRIDAVLPETVYFNTNLDVTEKVIQLLAR